MIKKILITLFAIIFYTSVYSQDILDNGDIVDIEKFKIDLNQRFSFGKLYNQYKNEDTETFVKRILGNEITFHHGAFKINEFKNSIVSFGTYKFQDTPIIIGFILEPTNSKRQYKLLKILELSSDCGNAPQIESVFLYNTDDNSLGKELVIHSSDNCGRHGASNYVFIYNGLVKDNKLTLKEHLSELCDYSEVKIDGYWDLDMGDENVEDRRYNKCNFSDFNAIKKALDNKKK